MKCPVMKKRWGQSQTRLLCLFIVLYTAGISRSVLPVAACAVTFYSAEKPGYAHTVDK